MSNLISSTRRHIVNIPGKRLEKKYIIFESDDWGSERIPSQEVLNALTSSGIDTSSNPFNHIDSLETGDDLSALFETLKKFKDHNGNHPIITANSVTANPDFAKIKASGFSKYFYESTLQSYTNKKGCEDSINIIKQGIVENIYHPQFHGREHLNVKQWITALQTGNEQILNAFSAGVYGIDLDIELTNRNNFMAAFDSNYENDFSNYENIIREGLLLFKEAFGYSSKSFIAPCYVWHSSLEKTLYLNGIRYIQGMPVQLSPDFGKKYKRIYHYQGQNNNNKQRYFIRNCFFEPSLKREFNYIEDCIRRIKIIFSYGKPAIIGTHRINFIGSLNESNRRENLNEFSELLKLILKTWPDVIFTTTDQLGDIY